jgi:hypothetical protein
VRSFEAQSLDGAKVGQRAGQPRWDRQEAIREYRLPVFALAAQLRQRRQEASNEKSTMVLVNAARVNGRLHIFSPPHFCEIFCDSGVFLDSWNPVKYICNLLINLKKA